MTTLIALISSGKGTWSEVLALIKAEKWEKVYLICNEFSYKNFNIDQRIALKLKYNEKNMIEDFDKLSDFFKKNIQDFEIALNLTSGTGIEHMALTSSILKAGLGIRFVYFKENELKEFKLTSFEFPEEDELEEV